jgi:PAS domain S-box-containing protein
VLFRSMWVYDIESLRFLMVNNAAVSHYGYAREEFLGMTLAEIHPPEDDSPFLQTFQSLTEGFDASGVWRHRKRDGSIISVEITSHMLNFGGRRARMVLAHDITDRKRSEEERARLQAQLLQAQKMEAIGRLAGGVAHDFNNMLGVILGHAELAQGQTADAEALRDHLEEIRKAGQRSADLTGQLLAFARKQTVAPRVIDLNDTVAGMIGMLRRIIGEDIHLAWMPGADLWPVRIDPAQIDQMLANLCVNARDAIASVGKVTIETDNVAFDEAYCTDHTGFSPGSYVMLGVSDDGSGMDRDVLEHLFEPFFTTKGVGKGTGLGLSMVYGIVKQNDGYINVYSEPGRGTTFKIYLRAYRDDTAQIPVGAPAQAAPCGTETILLVEDEEMLRELGKVMLEKLGYSVFTAGAPGEAIRLAEARAEEVDLLITDVVLPEMSGRDLADRIRVIKPRLKCLFMSGYTANVIAHQGVLDEGVKFIQKPFSIRDLAAKVREALEQP